MSTNVSFEVGVDTWTQLIDGWKVIQSFIESNPSASELKQYIPLFDNNLFDITINTTNINNTNNNTNNVTNISLNAMNELMNEIENNTKTQQSNVIDDDPPNQTSLPPEIAQLVSKPVRLCMYTTLNISHLTLLFSFTTFV